MADPAKKKEQEQEPKSVEERLENLENPRMGFWETAILHPVKHAFWPGAGNKVEAGFSLAGRGAAGYGLYLLGKIAYRKIVG